MFDADVNPEELRYCAAVLKSTSDEICDMRQTILSESAQLMDFWTDDKYARFNQLFVELLKQVEPLEILSVNISQKLNLKAFKIEEYLSR